MSLRYYLTGNSRTPIAFDSSWRVLDIGSGHHPHPRSNILADKFLLDNTERTGRNVIFLMGKPFVIADACRLPFKNKAFDFVICSHVAEHVDEVENFCSELNRVAYRGYIETPSVFNEKLLHVDLHSWFVSNHNGKLVFSPTSKTHPLGWFGKLFFSLHFYGTAHVRNVDVFPFAHGVRKPGHYFLVFIRIVLMIMLSLLWPLLYTRLHWQDHFSYEERGPIK